MKSQGLAENNNQVPPGYKQTEVGVIPEDWEVDKFINITEVITCGVAATPKYVTQTTGKPFLSAQNVQNGRVIYDNYKFISRELFAQITKYNKPTKGDILYTRVGAGIGEAGVIEDNFEFAIYVSLTLIKPKSQKLDSYWIAYLLNSGRYKFLARNGLFAGAGVQNLNVEVVRNFAIPLPPLPEQKAIASVLSDVDELISSLDKLIAKKRHIKTATMQQLLTGKTRLPGFGEEWENITLGDECTLITKGTTPTSVGHSFKEQGINFLKIESIAENGKILSEKLAYIDSITHKLLSRSQLKKKDVLFSIAGALGRCALIQSEFLPANTNQALAIIRLKDNAKIDNIFLLAYLKSSTIKKNIESINVQAAQANLSLKNIYDFKITAPPLPEQKAIASVLSDMDKEIAALEKRRAKTQGIKQGMMQELLTGRTRLINNYNGE